MPSIYFFYCSILGHPPICSFIYLPKYSVFDFVYFAALWGGLHNPSVDIHPPWAALCLKCICAVTRLLACRQLTKILRPNDMRAVLCDTVLPQNCFPKIRQMPIHTKSKWNCSQTSQCRYLTNEKQSVLLNQWPLQCYTSPPPLSMSGIQVWVLL